MNKIPLHFNKPQLRSIFVGAPVEYLVAGRGTGKTEGVLAYKTAVNYFDTMPRSSGVALGATYNQLLTRTLPSLVAGWERLGYVMGKHFLIGVKPTEKWIKQWNWKGPYRPPLNYKYFISWWNGSGCHLVSQDRAGSSNGITIDWIFGDELKLLNGEKLKTELIPANRGKVPAFKNNPYHHGMTFTTDMPTGTSGRWIFDMAEKMDKGVVKKILQLQKVIWLLTTKSEQSNKPVRDEIAKQVIVLNAEINDLRKGLLYYHEASTLDNIHALGADYIKQQLRDTTQFQFDTQILNMRPMKMEDGFYPDFDEDIHGYFANDNDYLDKIGYDFGLVKQINCLRDSDRNDALPLHISIDYNRRIHPLIVSQDDGTTIRVIKAMDVLFPEKLKDIVAQFCEYYKTHGRRLIYYWYDQTAVGDDNETRKCDEVISQLRANGWIVQQMYTSLAPAHEAKYRMYGHLFQEDGYYNKIVRFNRENCEHLITSIGMTEAEQRKEGFGKNKKSERDPKFPARESTHYSDAMDMLLYGMLECKIPYGTEHKNSEGIIT